MQAKKETKIKKRQGCFASVSSDRLSSFRVSSFVLSDVCLDCCDYSGNVVCEKCGVDKLMKLAGRR